MNQQTRTKTIPTRQVVTVWIIMTIITLLTINYIWLLMATVSNTAERSKIENSLPTLAAEVSEQEFRYLNLKNQLDSDLLPKQGLVMIDDIEFIQARALGHQIDLTIFR